MQAIEMRTLVSLGETAVAVVMVVLIQTYRLLLSPLLPQGSCRHEPSCSRYALDAISVHGPWRGGWLTLGRLLRCHPWGTMGYDPVPEPRRGGRDCGHAAHG